MEIVLFFNISLIALMFRLLKLNPSIQEHGHLDCGDFPVSLSVFSMNVPYVI